MTSYKTCAVPMCPNTTVKYPGKLFIHVPQNSAKRRNQWLQLAHRDPEILSKNTGLYFCEDHFDMPNDMENYVQYSVMGTVNQIRMKPDCLPSKFECQSDKINLTAIPPFPRSSKNKRRRMDLIEEICSKKTQMPATSGKTSKSNVIKSASKRKKVSTNFRYQMTQPYVKIRSKPEQTSSQAKYNNTSPIMINIMSTATSNFNTKPEAKSETFKKPKIKKKILVSSEKLEESSSSSLPSQFLLAKTDNLLSIWSLPIQSSNSNDQNTASKLSEIKRKIDAEQCQIATENTLRLIKEKPSYYIGVPNDCYFLIDLIQKHTSLPNEHILLCLKKIRLNTPFCELGDQFSISKLNVSKIFKKSLPVIANVLRPFVIKCNKAMVNQNLPIAFRHKYHDIFSIIDCLEIKIQKPSTSVEQALSWSEYKKANTVKYLISSTPDGIINYISPGYVGRITDISLVQNCGFLECLEPGVSILADRGFKHIEELLLPKHVNLVRPPSVSTHSKLSSETKQIASLRIHIERVKRCLREFSMFKPHSVVNKRLLKYLDDCVIIACALINLHHSIIK